MTHLDDESRVSSSDLLEAAGHLSLPEFERFAEGIMSLRARRIAPSFKQAEAHLILKINRGLPAKLRTRLEALTRKRVEESLTDKELANLKLLSEKAEKIELQRLKDLTKLARIRKTDLTGVMEQLGIRAPKYV